MLVLKSNIPSLWIIRWLIHLFDYRFFFFFKINDSYYFFLRNQNGIKSPRVIHLVQGVQKRITQQVTRLMSIIKTKTLHKKREEN